jgi:hypothetical protein
MRLLGGRILHARFNAMYLSPRAPAILVIIEGHETAFNGFFYQFFLLLGDRWKT